MKNLVPKSNQEWIALYTVTLNVPPSDEERFFRAIDIYGDMPVYEAIHITATKSIDGDPFNYVLTVAYSKWKESVEFYKNTASYIMRLEMAKERSRQANEELDNKLRKARKRRLSNEGE